MKKNIFPLFRYLSVLLALLLCGGFLCAQELSDREKQGQINYLYKMGTECYYRGKYSQAIKYWEAVLDIDPQQTQPPALIENAREQVQKESGPVYDTFKAAVKKGEFFEAQEHNLKLLDLDPTNADYKKMMKKLNRIVKLFPALPKNKDVRRLIRQSVYAYIIQPVDVELAFSSLRLARQKDPHNENIKKFFNILTSENPAASRKHVELEGVDILDQILQKALSNIYEGQYVEAITGCKRALKLDPKNVLAMKRLGSAYYALGNKKQAYFLWKKALNFDPEDRDLKQFLKGQ